MIDLEKKSKQRYNHTGERLTNAADPERVGFFGLWDLWHLYDKLRFGQLPDMMVWEYPDLIELDGNGRDLTTARFQFTNLEESLGRMARIVVFYEEADPKHSPSNLSLSVIQRMKVILDIPAFTVGNNFVYDVKIPVIRKPATIYNFYAIYLDTVYMPATIKGEPVISYAINIPFYGAGRIEAILEVKDLQIDGYNPVDYGDIDGVGYKQDIYLPGYEAKLQWANLNKLNIINSDIDISSLWFNDTFANKFKLNQTQLKKVDYYVVYKFTSSNGKGPAIKYPQNINYQFNWTPSIKDLNGKWEFVARTSNSYYTVPLIGNKIYSFWVGCKLNNDEDISNI